MAKQNKYFYLLLFILFLTSTISGCSIDEKVETDSGNNDYDDLKVRDFFGEQYIDKLILNKKNNGPLQSLAKTSSGVLHSQHYIYQDKTYTYTKIGQHYIIKLPDGNYDSHVFNNINDITKYVTTKFRIKERPIVKKPKPIVKSKPVTIKPKPIISKPKPVTVAPKPTYKTVTPKPVVKTKPKPVVKAKPIVKPKTVTVKPKTVTIKPKPVVKKRVIRTSAS